MGEREVSCTKVYIRNDETLPLIFQGVLHKFYAESFKSIPEFILVKLYGKVMEWKLITYPKWH
jgi:hypothetical protein